jgi:AcrR family transcriptional regulator
LSKKGLRTRQALLDATEEVMVSEGYAAVTTRKVASRLGVTPGDLLLATYRRAAERRAERVRALLESGTPLRALWRNYLNSTESALALELAAMAVHRSQVRDEMAYNIEQVRRMQASVFADILEKNNLTEWIAPELASLMFFAVARTYLQERSLGVTYGVKGLPELIEAFIDRFEPLPAEALSPKHGSVR